MLLAGPPLSGKTTFAEHLIRALPAATVHVENDRLRPPIAEALGQEAPVFSADETHLTYVAARALIERGLEAGMHVVHDATNLREDTRAKAHALAGRLETPTRVVFLEAPEPVREDRAHEEGEAAEQAHAALGDRAPAMDASTRPAITLDGTRAPGDNVRELLASEGFEHLVETATGGT